MATICTWSRNWAVWSASQVFSAAAERPGTRSSSLARPVPSSTGVKSEGDPPDRYVEAFAGGDIQTNPPATNAVVEKAAKSYTRHIDEMPSPEIVAEIDRTVDMAALERGLMAEGIEKFVEPQRALLRLIAQKRAAQLARGGRPPGPGPQHT